MSRLLIVTFNLGETEDVTANDFRWAAESGDTDIYEVLHERFDCSAFLMSGE